MQRWPYLDALTGDMDDPLPPSSPPVVQPSSPLTITMLETQDPNITIHASSDLSSPPESPALRSESLILPTTVLATIFAPNGGGSDDSFQQSSPVRGPDDRKRKTQKRRAEEREARTRLQSEEAKKRRTTIFKQCLSTLSTNKLTFGELTEYVLFHEDQPISVQSRSEKFLVNGDLITRMLNLFASSKAPKACQKAVKDWVRPTVLQAIIKEVNAATRSGALQMTEREIDSSFVSGLSFDDMKATVREHCPTFHKLLVNVITTSRQVERASQAQLAAKEHVRFG